MTAEAMLRILALMDVAFQQWADHGQDEADLLALREQLKDKTIAEKVQILTERSQSLQDRADALRDR